MADLAGQRTFLEMQTELASIWLVQSGLSTTSYPTLVTAKLLLNKYLKIFCSKYEWLWVTKSTTINTASGTTLLTMPDLVRKVGKFQIRANGRDLVYMTMMEFERMFPLGWTNVTNTQPIYYIEAQPAANGAIQFNLFPTPDATYTISYDYLARFTPMSADADVPVIPPEWDNFILWRAAMEGLIMLGDVRASSFKGMADELEAQAWLDNEKLLNKQLSWVDAPEMQTFGMWPGQATPYLPG